jgi:hypothetical protein
MFSTTIDGLNDATQGDPAQNPTARTRGTTPTSSSAVSVDRITDGRKWHSVGLRLTNGEG